MMPYLKVTTNIELSDSDQQAFLSEASKQVAQLLGKPERYVLAELQVAKALIMSGSTDPTAYVELKSIGLPESNTGQLSAGLCQFIQDSLQIEGDRIYIEFSNVERHLWGWNGSTF